MVGSFPKVLAMALVVIATVCACSSKNQDAAQPQTLVAARALTGADIFKLYDPSSLVEVRNFSDLPDGVKALANRSGMDAKGEGPDGRLRQFLVGGLSKTSALVAYEQFGYVPTYMADAYVKNGSDWVAIRSWKIGQVTTLDEARNMIQALPEVTPPAPNR